MFLARLRLACLIAAFLTSLNVAAAARYWTLTDVQFSDSAIATGYIGYDDLTKKITDWNIRVTPGLSTAPYASFTYVPANSDAATFSSGHFQFTARAVYTPVEGLFEFVANARTLVMPWPGPWDGTSVIVQLGHNGGFEYRNSFSDELTSDELTYVDISRALTAGSLVLIASPPTSIVQIDEFYNATLDHYFVTANAAEKQDLDTGVRGGWVRTGEFFKAHAAGSAASGSINPVCRYYGQPQAGLDSHFYWANLDECIAMFKRYDQSVWQFESDNVFQISLPDKRSGACPAGTVPVYRLWNHRTDANHRYTAHASTRLRMLAAGFLSEGYGPEGVAMCAQQ